MNAYRAALLVAAALVLGAAGAAAQGKTPAPIPRPLPPGLTQSGGTIMMQPVRDPRDSEAPATAAPAGTTAMPTPPDRDADDDDQDTAALVTPEVRPSLIHILGPDDHDIFTKAFAAANHDNWSAARALSNQGHDATAQALITWRYVLDKNSGASFAEIDSFLRAHPDWPLRHLIERRAEHAMPDAMASAAIVAWFGTRTPETGIGKVRLGEALIAEGRRTEGRALIRNAWINDTFEPDEERQIIAQHGDILTPGIDRERLNHLLWRGDLAAARRELSRVSGTAQRLGEVRMALRTHPRAGERMVARLPQSLQANPALIFDRARGLRLSGGGDDEPQLLVKAPTRAMARIDPRHWWRELALAARQAMKDNSYNIAYEIVSGTGLEDGGDFAEAEFMAGWIALRFLHKPEQALPHFERLAAGVSRPISVARAYYWIGRTYEAERKLADATRAYAQAAENPETFYGQLALARIEQSPRLRLTETPVHASRARVGFETDDLTRAIRVLADLGQERFVRMFAVKDAELHPGANHTALLASDLVRMGFRDVAVRVAKMASYDGVDLLSYSHPVIALPRYRGPGKAPERALVLALIRQETEFNPDAVSRVGALGMMQLMPRTARHMARLARLPYRHSRLRTDVHYNIELGMTELATDLSDWNGSYILAAAAYNAGPANVRKWIATYGDPRDGGVDPIDWIEEIPYSETRNYVQRVIENMEVYRNRLAGRSEPLRILADLYRPNPPPHLAALGPVPTLPATPVPIPEIRPARAGIAPADVASMAPTETAELEQTAVPVKPAIAPQPDPPAAAIPKPRPADIVLPKQRPAR